jgi:hypothetical protein
MQNRMQAVWISILLLVMALVAILGTSGVPR